MDLFFLQQQQHHFLFPTEQEWYEHTPPPLLEGENVSALGFQHPYQSHCTSQ